MLHFEDAQTSIIVRGPRKFVTTFKDALAGSWKGVCGA